MSIPLDVSFGVTYITPMTQRTSPLAVTRTAAGWNVCHKATGLVVLAAAACPVVNAVIRTLGAARRAQFAPAVTVSFGGAA